MRSRLTELNEHLKEKAAALGVKVENYESEMENAVTRSAGLKISEQGLHFMNLHYRGVIWVDEMPQKHVGLLLCLVWCWLLENDDTRDTYSLDDPEFDIVEMDNKLCNVEIAIDFVDPFYLTETENGPIEFNGKTYDDGEFDLWIAETGTVIHDGVDNNS